MRKAIVFAAVAAAMALASPAASADGSGLTYACTPPQPPAAANCAAWHTTTVELRWSYDTINFGPAQVQGSDCTSPRKFDNDTAGTNVMCAVWKSDQSGLANLIATIRIDKTPPSVTGFTADRPPDSEGWFNHPVGLRFNGTDATSGISGCDVVSYSGPDGVAAPATGSCRDVAGNAASGTFPISYDSTPPTLTALPATTKVGRTTLNWTTSDDAVQTRIVRSPGIGTAPASEIYAGPGHTFTDSGIAGGRRYTYTLTSWDQAANSVTATVAATAKKPPPPSLRWHRVKSADYYNVQLYRGKQKVLSVWPHRNHLQLRRSWTFRGHKRVLAAGSYRWYVWPGFGRRSQHRYGKLIAHRSFKIAPAQSAER